MRFSGGRFPFRGRGLEIGCGSGRDSLFMASLACSVVAADGRERMLEEARRHFAGENAEGITLRLAHTPSLQDIRRSRRSMSML